GKTVFVSSHLLAEVTQMADLVGIIATGRLVREGSIDDLLREMGSLSIRVGADESVRAREVLAAFGTVTTPTADRPEEAWLSCRSRRRAAARSTGHWPRPASTQPSCASEPGSKTCSCRLPRVPNRRTARSRRLARPARDQRLPREALHIDVAEASATAGDVDHVRRAGCPTRADSA